MRKEFNAPFLETSMTTKTLMLPSIRGQTEDEPDKALTPRRMNNGLGGQLFWAVCKAKKGYLITSIERKGTPNKWTLIYAKDTQSYPILYLSWLISYRTTIYIRL